MTEQRTFRIAVDLVADNTGTKGPLDATLSVLKSIRSELQAARGDTADLGRAFEGASGPAGILLRQASGIAEAMERAAQASGRMSFPASFGGSSGVSPALPGTGVVVAGPATGGGGPSFRGMPDAPGAPLLLAGPGGQSPIPINLDPPTLPKPGGGASPHDALGVIGTGIIGADMIKGVTKFLLDPAYQIGNDEARLRARMTDNETRQAILAARQAQTAMPYTSVEGNLEVYRTLLSLTQNPDESRKLLPTFLPFGTAMQQFNPNAGSAAEQLEGVIKSAEFVGMVSKVDPATGEMKADGAAASKLADILLHADVLSKGAVDPANFLRFLRAGGTAAATMSIDDIPAMLPLIQAMNPARAGTALQGFNQQFGAGKMSEYAAQELIDFGIISGGGRAHLRKGEKGTQNAFVQQSGMGQYRINAGGLSEDDANAILFHPAQFVHDRILPKIDAQLAKEQPARWTNADGKTRTAMEAEALQQVASRIPGGTFMGELVRNWALMVRDGGAAKALSGKDMVTPLVNSPSAKLDALSNSLNHFLGVAGEKPLEAAIGGLDHLTAAITAFNKLGDAHPDVAHGVGTMAATGGVLGAVMAGLGFGGWGAKKLGAEGLGAFLSNKAAALKLRGGEAMAIPMLWSFASGNADVWAKEDAINPIHRAVDAWLFKHTGGLVGGGSQRADQFKLPTKADPVPVQIVGAVPPVTATIANPHDIAHATATGMAASMAATPAGGPGSHPISQPQMPGRH